MKNISVRRRRLPQNRLLALQFCVDSRPVGASALSRNLPIRPCIRFAGAANGGLQAMQSDYVFEGQKRHKPLSYMSMLMLLRRMQVEGVTVHGFRSTFRKDKAELRTSSEVYLVFSDIIGCPHIKVSE